MRSDTCDNRSAICRPEIIYSEKKSRCFVASPTSWRVAFTGTVPRSRTVQKTNWAKVRIEPDEASLVNVLAFAWFLSLQSFLRLWSLLGERRVSRRMGDCVLNLSLTPFSHPRLDTPLSPCYGCYFEPLKWRFQSST
ncbi:hypothetical protein BDN72DRAFT_619423 [Pluteus cervinus]|uniref:Uncharacterized protein n=1 Tax=Pluteus cervinus TaxID=181527 RepID=A0ACD3AU21_9AGAR|nr:hypothetical protein BDN72DRAFT_619423 [Pluteus cervinus]